MANRKCTYVDSLPIDAVTISKYDAAHTSYTLSDSYYSMRDKRFYVYVPAVGKYKVLSVCKDVHYNSPYVNVRSVDNRSFRIYIMKLLQQYELL